MKNSLRRFKIRIFLELTLQILGVVLMLAIGVFLIDGILNDFIANLLFRIDSDLYRFAVVNKVLLLGIVFSITVMSVIYFTIKKTTNYMERIINSIDKVIKKDEDLISLPVDFKDIEDKLNSIKFEALRNEQSAKEEKQKRDDLIVYLAHDLKTPLTSMIGYLSLLHDEKGISEELKTRYTQIALDKSYRLENLINEFFDITRFSFQNMTLNQEKINLSLMLQQLTDEFYPLFEEKQLTCTLNIQSQIEIEADGDKLARVFDNLLRNALAYCDSQSEIKIEMGVTEKQVQLVFSNKGPHLSCSQLDQLFDKFYRADPSRSAATGGAGLGLAIAKEIVVQHNGTIHAEYENHRISFYITLPR